MSSDASTPLMRQYNSIKEQVPHALLMFRLGDFYELFFEDAVVAARELEITLTSRHKEKGAAIPMCGVPYHAAEGYIARLIQKGHRVAICDQVEDPKLTKKLVRKRIVEDGLRVDGRGTADIRPLSAEIDLFPTAHGSALFQRGETQVLNVTTLGMPRMNQLLDTIPPVDKKRYMHHYNFPPFSTGETGRVGGLPAKARLVPPFAVLSLTEGNRRFCAVSSASNAAGTKCAWVSTITRRVLLPIGYCRALGEFRRGWRRDPMWRRRRAWPRRRCAPDGGRPAPAGRDRAPRRSNG